MDLVSSWNELWAQLDSKGQISVALGVVGVAIIVVSILVWLWRQRKSQGGQVMQGFPWMAMIVGGLLAAPTVIIPVFLIFVEGLLNLLVYLVTWVAGLF